MWNTIKKLFGRGDADLSQQINPVQDHGDALSVVIRCDRCEEDITVRMRKASDIQRNYGVGDHAFFVQKTVVGTQCFNRMEMRLEFDPRYRLISSEVIGGTLVSG